MCKAGVILQLASDVCCRYWSWLKQSCDCWLFARGATTVVWTFLCAAILVQLAAAVSYLYLACLVGIQQQDHNQGGAEGLNLAEGPVFWQGVRWISRLVVHASDAHHYVQLVNELRESGVTRPCVQRIEGPRQRASCNCRRHMVVSVFGGVSWRCKLP